MKAIKLHGQTAGGGAHPLICTPLVGKTAQSVFEELAIVLPKKPDLIEWRVDFFSNIGDTALVIDVASRIREAAGAIPIIFTCRSVNYGGERVALNDIDIMKLYVAACASRCVDLIDYELSNSPEYLVRLRNTSRDNDVAMIMTYQNFESTPAPEVLTAKFLEAERLGADIAKVAVMASCPEDVLTLLDATAHGSKLCTIPLIAVSMGRSGSLSRVFAWVYGSTVTFAFGHKSSAPGQISIEEMRVALASVHHVYRARSAPARPISKHSMG